MIMCLSPYGQWYIKTQRFFQIFRNALIYIGGGGGGGGGGGYVWFVSMQQPKGSVILMAQIQIPPFSMHTSSLCKVSCLFSTGKSAPGSPLFLFLSLFIYERGMQLFLYDKLPFELLPREKLL